MRNLSIVFKINNDIILIFFMYEQEPIPAFNQHNRGYLLLIDEESGINTLKIIRFLSIIGTVSPRIWVLPTGSIVLIIYYNNTTNYMSHKTDSKYFTLAS